jgi:hypothetical protein
VWDVEARHLSCAAGIAPEFAASYVARCFVLGGSDPQSEAAKAKAEIEAGHTRFDPARAARCLDALQIDPATCWGESAPFVHGYWPVDPMGMLFTPPSVLSGVRKPIPDDCAAVFSGLVPDGAQCDDWRDCSSRFCELDGTGRNRTICYPATREGEQCAMNRCAASLFCAASNLCSPVRHEGDSCTAADHCSSTLTCDDCEFSLGCVNDRCTKADVGQPCGELLPDCKSGLLCDMASIPGTCHPPPPQHNCAQTTLDPPCVGNQICFGPPDHGTCDIPQDVGGPCLVGLPGRAAGCFAGLICDPATAKCALPPKTGQPCVDGVCDPFTAFCSNGTCKAQLAAGQRCDFKVDVCEAPTQCLDGVCQKNSIDPGFSPPPPCFLR